ncbi:MAG: DUF4249 domain-containing protein [Bacteroidales bacterium]|nr:DUF4249 domain-containing protein [Bacteroidales bacterium]
MKATFPLFILIIAFLVGCEKTEKIEDFPKTAPKMALNCIMIPDSGITVIIYKSLSILDNAPNKVLNQATLELFKDGVSVGKLEAANHFSYYYFPDIKPEPGHEYKLTASLKGFETITAASDIPSKAEITNLSTIVRDTSSWGWVYGTNYFFSTGKLILGLKDDHETENYYRLSMYMLDTTYSFNEYGDTVDTFIYRNSLQDYNNESSNPMIEFTEGESYYFSDQYLNGKEFTIELPIRYSGSTPGDSLFIELSAISMDLYLFKKSMIKYNDSQSNPFSEPIKIYTNIENGYGIFAGSSIITKRIRYN